MGRQTAGPHRSRPGTYIMHCDIIALRLVKKDAFRGMEMRGTPAVVTASESRRSGRMVVRDTLSDDGPASYLVRQTAAQTQARNIAVVACTMPMGVVRFRRIALPQSQRGCLASPAARHGPPAAACLALMPASELQHCVSKG